MQMKEKSLEVKTNYLKFFASRLTSVCGDSLQEVAIVILIASYTNSVFIAGCITALNALVRILGSMFAIRLTVSLSPKRMLIRLNLLYFLLTFIFYALLQTNHELHYVVVIAYETLCSLVYTYYKMYVDTMTKLVCVNNAQISRLMACDNLVGIGTTLVSSILLMYFDVSFFLVFNALSFLLAAFLIRSIHVDTAVKTQDLCSANRHIVPIIRSFVRENREVFQMIVIMAELWLFYSAFNILLQQGIDEFDLHSEVSGVLMGLFNLVSLIFTFLVGYIQTQKILQRVTVLLLLCSLVGLGLNILDGKAYMFGVIGIYGCLNGGIMTLMVIYIQNSLALTKMITYKSIYNVLCGSAIFLTGIVTPMIVEVCHLKGFVTLLSVNCLWLFVWFRKKGITAGSK